MSKSGRTFQFNLDSIFIVSILLPVILTCILFSVYYYQVIMKQEKQNIEHFLNSVSNNIELQFTELTDIGSTFYLQKDIFREGELLNNPKLYEYYDDLTLRELEKNYSITFTKMLFMTNQEIKNIVFFPINSERQISYYIDKKSSILQAIPYRGYEKEEWFLKALETNGESVFFSDHTPAYLKSQNGESIYSYARAIKNMDTQKDIGVIRIDVNLENLWESINVFQVDSQDGLIISSKEDILIKTDSLPEKIKVMDKDAGYIYDGGKTYYQRSVTLFLTDWKLTYVFPMDTFWKSYLSVMLVVCIVIILVVFMAFGIYRRNSKEIIADVSEITNVLKEVQKGNLEVSVMVNTQSELKNIANAINQMVYNLKDHIDQEYILVINQQKAEFMALQSQINPHFLYNSLNGFIALNRMGETKKLEKSIISLTRLFRYTSTQNDITTISEEVDFLKEFLSLEKLKYEERLEYVIQINENCAERKIPKLLLQPIVENSIIHGMGNTDKPITITIIVHEKNIKGLGKVTEICIQDDGVGYNQKEISLGKDHVGIENVKTRFELYYKNAVFQSISTPGKGTKTVFIFTE